MSKSFLEIKPLCFHEERFYAFWDDVHPPKWTCYHCEYDKMSAAYTEAIKLCDEMAEELRLNRAYWEWLKNNRSCIGLEMTHVDGNCEFCLAEHRFNMLQKTHEKYDKFKEVNK